MSTINEAIQLTELLLQKYKHEIDPPTHLQCAVKLKHIKDKYADKRLYVSVIGEFSTGKSTFINALLRENLLDSNVVQGTTTVNSIIEHGDALNMLVYPHGSSEVKDLTAIGYSNEIIREYIKSVHRGESAKSIKKVVVKHPSDFLSKGVVVIDTPGTNTPEVWHEKVTKEALDLSDASIILTSANQPVPESLVSFVKENVSTVLGHCIFLVTKIDTLRMSEREDQLEYIRYTIQKKLGVENPIVVPYSPLLVLEDKVNMEPSYQKNDRGEILKSSYQSENIIVTYIKEHREIALKEKLSLLLIELLDKINVDIEKKVSSYQKRSDLLRANTKMDLKSFSKKYRVPPFEREIDTFIKECRSDLDEALDDDMLLLHDTLFQCNSEAQIRNYSNYVIEVINFRKNTTEKIIKEIVSEFVKYSNQSVKEFESALNQEYKGLDALLPRDRDIPRNTSKISFDNIPNITINLPTSDSGAKIGGAAVGATLGSLILPGAGTLIGGVIGGFVGSLWGADLNTRKSQVWSEIKPKIDQQHDCLKNIVTINLRDYSRKLDSQVLSIMDLHLERCKSKIDYLMCCDKREREEIEKQIKEINDDKERISQITNALKNSQN